MGLKRAADIVQNFRYREVASSNLAWPTIFLWSVPTYPVIDIMNQKGIRWWSSMGLAFETIITVIHRIGMILALIPAIVIIVLPSIFPKQDDHDFASRTYQVLLNIARGGILLLVFSGMIRLQYEIPTMLPVKLIFAGISLGVFFHINTTYSQGNFTRISALRVMSVVVTGIVGIVM